MQSVGKPCREEFRLISILDSTSSRLFSKGIWHTSGNSCLILPPWYQTLIQFLIQDQSYFMIKMSDSQSSLNNLLHHLKPPFNKTVFTLLDSVNGQRRPMVVFPSRWLVTSGCVSTSTHVYYQSHKLHSTSLCASLTTAQGGSVGKWEKLSTHTDDRTRVWRVCHIWTAAWSVV